MGQTSSQVMPVSSAYLYSQLDSPDAAKQLQTERGVATSPPHFSLTSVLWETEHSARVVLSQNSVLSLVPKKIVRNVITIFLQASDPSLKQMSWPDLHFSRWQTWIWRTCTYVYAIFLELIFHTHSGWDLSPSFPSQVLSNTSKATSVPWNEPNQKVFTHLHKNLIIAWGFCGVFFLHTGDILSGSQKWKQELAHMGKKIKKSNHHLAVACF